MSKTIIIAEKPSVAQDIVRALASSKGKFEKHADHFENDDYVVTSAVGHLVEIKAPEDYDVKRGKWSFAQLPVVPPHFDVAPIDKAKTCLLYTSSAGPAAQWAAARPCSPTPGPWLMVAASSAGLSPPKMRTRCR